MVNRAALSILLIFLLSGCSLIPTSSIVNEIIMVQAVGFDSARHGHSIGTFAYPFYKNPDSTKTEIKSATGKSSKEIQSIINGETPLRLVTGQLRIALYGKDLAKKGINDFVDTLNRDPSIGADVQLAIVDGSAKEMLNLSSDERYQDPNIALYLQEMLTQNMTSGQLPNTDLQTYLFQLFQVGQDPFLPVIKIVDNEVRITDLAFFNYDKFVTSIPIEDAYTFKLLLRKGRSSGVHPFTMENGDEVVLETLSSNPNYTVKVVNGHPEFTIHLTMKTRLQEFSPLRVKRESFNRAKHQKELESVIEKNAGEIIEHFKKHNVDPLGLGAKFKQQYRDFDEKRWNDIYPNVKVNVHADIIIEQTGTID